VTVTWYTITETVTSPGYAPTPVCQVTTVTNTIPSTTHITYTYDLLYVYQSSPPLQKQPRLYVV
jgi:hypothetical protein